MNEDQNNSGVELLDWNPAQELRVSDPKTVKYSTGFLRSQPRQWFPGMKPQWLALAHSLGIDLELVEVTPVLSAPSDLEFSYSAKVDSEYITIMSDAESASVLVNSFAPGGSELSKDLLAEYLARRFFTSLASTWSGPEIPRIKFDAKAPKILSASESAIKIVANINSQQCTLWINLESKLVQMLDGLWKRQVSARVPSAGDKSLIRLEVGHLSVPPSILTEYLKTGAAVDLEIPVSDRVNLVVDREPWLPARMWQVDGRFAVETIAGFVPNLKVAEGTTKLSIQIASIPFSDDIFSSLSQPEAMFDTGVGLNNEVSLIIHGEEVGRATLKNYQGRFVINVI